MITLIIQESVQIIYYVTKMVVYGSYRICRYIFQPRISNRESEMNEIIEIANTLQQKLKELEAND